MTHRHFDACLTRICLPVRKRLLLSLVCLAIAAIGGVARADEFRIGVIDFYGLHRVSPNDLRPHLAVHEGDVISLEDEQWHESFAQTQRQLSNVPGVLRAHLDGFLCCTNGQLVVYIGIEEAGARSWKLNRPPKGAVRLPSEVVASGDEFFEALMPAVARGDDAEDDTAGHALFHAPELRRIQPRFIEYAQIYLPLLREALRFDVDPKERALAAQILGYAEDKQAVVPDLVRAMRDPSIGVRNTAMRTLLVFTKKENADPSRAIVVPYEPFVPFLNSPFWEDRNKSSWALEQLTRARNPKILRALRRHSLAALCEMARWRAHGHADAALKILGRIGGYSEDEIVDAITNGRREELILAAN